MDKEFFESILNNLVAVGLFARAIERLSGNQVVKRHAKKQIKIIEETQKILKDEEEQNEKIHA